jgi:hypothetical protein
MTDTLKAFVEKNDEIGLKIFLLENYRDVDTSKIEVTNDYYTRVDEDMANSCEDIKNVIMFCIDMKSANCLKVFLSLYSFIDFNNIAIYTLVKGEIELYNIVLGYTTEIQIAKTHLCIIPFKPDEIIKSLDTLLSLSDNNQILCEMLYTNITLGCMEYIEDIHNVISKHANPEKHFLFEERMLELLGWAKSKELYKFIISHPEYTWRDRNGNYFLHYLALSEIHCGIMKEILGINNFF